jgi:hypothetical protein
MSAETRILNDPPPLRRTACATIPDQSCGLLCDPHARPVKEDATQGVDFTPAAMHAGSVSDLLIMGVEASTARIDAIAADLDGAVAGRGRSGSAGPTGLPVRDVAAHLADATARALAADATARAPAGLDPLEPHGRDRCSPGRARSARCGWPRSASTAASEPRRTGSSPQSAATVDFRAVRWQHSTGKRTLVTL